MEVQGDSISENPGNLSAWPGISDTVHVVTGLYYSVAGPQEKMIKISLFYQSVICKEHPKIKPKIINDSCTSMSSPQEKPIN